MITENYTKKFDIINNNNTTFERKWRNSPASTEIYPTSNQEKNNSTCQLAVNSVTHCNRGQLKNLSECTCKSIPVFRHRRSLVCGPLFCALLLPEPAQPVVTNDGVRCAIQGVPNDVNCDSVLASALRIGITTASTEVLHIWTVSTTMGWDVSICLTQLMYHGRIFHLARAASTWRRDCDWCAHRSYVPRDTLYWMKTKGVNLAGFPGTLPPLL